MKIVKRLDFLGGGMKNGALDLPNWNVDDYLEVSLNHKDYPPEI